MRSLLILILTIIGQMTAFTQLTVSVAGSLPESVSNNAVCEGFSPAGSFLYSFGGIDSTKEYSGIHLRSFRFNVQTGVSEPIADLPDTLGKIACAASRIGNIIYISGGYHVFADESELSSNRMHRFDIAANQFLSDGKNIPIATDDHVQVVWRDSLIYLITGWSNVGNIPAVQIYNASKDEWMTGTSLPNANDYKSFGASGMIVGDTIYYFGGATSAPGFGIQNKLRRGIIIPDDPTKIQWSLMTPDPNINGYRMASTVVEGDLHWVGGSNQTYNYDGIAYNGSGGVPPSNRDLTFNLAQLNFDQQFLSEIPMDLRGISEVDPFVKYLAGGMLSDQHVTNKVFKLEWQQSTSAKDLIEIPNTNFNVYPNPFPAKFIIRQTTTPTELITISVYDLTGRLMLQKQENGKNIEVQCDSIPDGNYLLKISNGTKVVFQKMLSKID